MPISVRDIAINSTIKFALKCERRARKAKRRSKRSIRYFQVMQDAYRRLTSYYQQAGFTTQETEEGN